MANEADTSGSGTLAPRTLEFTPTWALASVATAFVIISMCVERLLHFLAKYLRETKRKPLLAALSRMKDELMLMGFISLTITILQDPVSKLCVPSSAYDKWTPCDISGRPRAASTTADSQEPASSQLPTRRRLLESEPAAHTCQAGYEPFISTNTIHQLHIFIVLLALVHVVYSCLTMLCALFRVYRWRKWENEAHKAANETRIPDLIKNITLNRQSTFVRYHTSKPWSRSRFVVWLVCFFQQFFIPRADYLALRLSFINTHNLKDTYDFHSYMVRTMEDEFETIVGISAWLWGCVVVLWVLNVDGAQLYFWTSLIPVFVVFIIGTKLQHVIATLALENMSVPGPLVPVSIKPRDQLFWFNRPKLLLSVIHLILFDTAFEFATFLWHAWQFGYKTCLLESNKNYLWGRLIIGLAVLLFSSYSTLPLYALVTQMGSNYKKAVLSKNVERVLLQWHKGAKQRVKANASASETRLAPSTPSSSSLILHFKSKVTRSSPLEHNRGSFPSLDIPSRAELEKGSLSDVVKESSQSPADHVMRMEEGALNSVGERLTAEHIWGRPIRALPGSLRATHSIQDQNEGKSPTTTASPSTSTSPTWRPPPPKHSRSTSATTSRPTSQTIGEVQYLPPHPAFNHSRSDAVLQRQSSTPSFEIQRDYS